jgi:magnesium-transporting ATPase (P-type)
VDSNFVISGLEMNGYDESSQGGSTHLTYCFNIFVMMQIFNFLNARKLEDEFNVFEGMSAGSYFTIIVLVIMLLQVFILTFGNIAFRCAPWVRILGINPNRVLGL